MQNSCWLKIALKVELNINNEIKLEKRHPATTVHVTQRECWCDYVASV